MPKTSSPIERLEDHLELLDELRRDLREGLPLSPRIGAMLTSLEGAIQFAQAEIAVLQAEQTPPADRSAGRRARRASAVAPRDE